MIKECAMGQYYHDDDMVLQFVDSLFIIEPCQAKLLNATRPHRTPQLTPVLATGDQGSNNGRHDPTLSCLELSGAAERKSSNRNYEE